MSEAWEYNDGGRKAAHFKGDAGDCVVRAIAIALELTYSQVYEELKEANREFMTGRCRAAKKQKRKGASPRNGNYRKVYQAYLESKGWRWKPVQGIGTGCTTHLRADELPGGRIIARLSRHICAVIDGVVNDTYDCTRDGTRCVYGYFYKGEDNG